jgi:hypothetical protein
VGPALVTGNSANAVIGANKLAPKTAGLSSHAFSSIFDTLFAPHTGLILIF